MRLTIVRVLDEWGDPTTERGNTYVVVEIVENADEDWLAFLFANYGSDAYVWFVTPVGEMPRHAHSNRWGQIVDGNDTPIMGWTRCEASA